MYSPLGTSTHFSGYAVDYGKANEEPEKPKPDPQKPGEPGNPGQPGKPGQKTPKNKKGLVKTNLDSNVLGFVVVAIGSLGMTVVVGKKRRNK